MKLILVISTLILLLCWQNAVSQEIDPQLATNAFDALINAMTAGDLSRVPKEPLLQLSPATVENMDPEKKKVLPHEIETRAAVERHLAADSFGYLLTALPVNQVEKMNWKEIAPNLRAKTLNGLPTVTIGAINWDAVMPRLPASTMKNLEPRVLRAIPLWAWANLPKASFEAMSPRVVSDLPLSAVLSIPKEHWIGLPPAQLWGYDKEVLAAVEPKLLLKMLESAPTSPQERRRFFRTFRI